ncbi:hypothetical protein CHS0354_027586 [Potamilus streckersoni]|uniref:Coiled-coil domain-containing protein 112 n=1 Tax=Potamilus streckersoni TaxID=2493646 RepID=A0AAE0S3X2_9BIVA|nr:hypothetical protein CHS0354_027586 [Potamilus streckersoni]
MESKLNTDRSTEQVRLLQQLEKIGHMVRRFHKELRDIQPTPEFLEKLKMIMEDIEGTINLFKEQQRKNYEELMREERITYQEIQALEKKFDTWSQISGSSLPKKTPKNQTLASARDITKDLPPEVASFEKFMEQNGGIRGGWDEYDHQTFLKFRLRYQGKAAFIKHLLPAIPTRTEEEIQQHEEWYQEYLFLNDTKKDAIKKWREKREVEKEDILANATEEPEDPDTKQQKLQEIIEEERRERKSKLNSWRVQKELEKAQAEEKKLREQLMKAKKEEEWKQKQTELKAKVDEYKKEKQKEEEFLKRQQEEWERDEIERQRQISAREIVRFRERK